MERSEYLEIIESVASKTIQKTLISIITKRFAFFAWGPAASLLSLVIEKIVALIIKETEMRVFFIHTDLRVSAQGKAFIDKANAYQRDKNEVNEKALIDSFREFARLR